MSMINRCANQGRRTTTGTPAAGEVTGVCSLSGIEKGAHMKSFYLKSAIAAVLLGAATMAFGVPPEGKGPPTGGELSNNLSVPTIMIGAHPFSAVCGSDVWSELLMPEGVPVWKDGYCIIDHDGGEICVPEGYYFLQRQHPWQAQCMSYTLAEGEVLAVNGAFGDNLSGDAKLKATKPIRVELVLEDASEDQATGYEVIKLELDKLDRVSEYGTQGTATLFTPGVFSMGARFDVFYVDEERFVINDLPVSAEINSKGRILYGYNLRVDDLGRYKITFRVPNIEFGTVTHADDIAGNETSIFIDVISGGGGGGKPNK